MRDSNGSLNLSELSCNDIFVNAHTVQKLIRELSIVKYDVVEQIFIRDLAIFSDIRAKHAEDD